MPYLAYSEDDEAYDTEGLMGESDEAEDYGEAARRPVRPRFGGPIKLPPKGGNVPPRPATGFATRAELTATANRIDAKIGTVSTGIKALDGRVRELGMDVDSPESLESAYLHALELVQRRGATA